MLLLYVGSSYLYSCYRRYPADFNVEKIQYMKGVMSALMQGALPEAYNALSNLSPYSSSEYIDELAEMFGSFLKDAKDYTLRSFVDEYGSWSAAPLSRSIYEDLDDGEIVGEVGHAIAMHQAFPDMIRDISSMKEAFIIESIAAFTELDLLYIHYKLKLYTGHLDCDSLDYIIAADGDQGVQAVKAVLSDLAKTDFICCLNMCNSFEQLNLDFDASACADFNVSQCFYEPMQDIYAHCYYPNTGSFCS